MRKKKEQYWQEHITGWRASSLSQAAYCRKHGISKSTFWLWKRKLTDPKSKTAAPEIVPVSLERIIEAPLPKPIRLYVGEFRLEIEAGFCKQTLVSVQPAVSSIPFSSRHNPAPKGVGSCVRKKNSTGKST